MDFVEICKVYGRKVIIKAAKRIFNSDEICRSYSDLNIGVTFFGTQCMMPYQSADRDNNNIINAEVIVQRMFTFFLLVRLLSVSFRPFLTCVHVAVVKLLVSF